MKVNPGEVWELSFNDTTSSFLYLTLNELDNDPYVVRLLNLETGELAHSMIRFMFPEHGRWQRII